MAASFQQESKEHQLDSTLDSVDLADQAVIEFARKIGFDEDDQNSISMAVRECMVNAVAHGNQYNSRKKVYLKLEATPDSLTVSIGDEGNGFDESEVPDPLAQENLLKQSGRGLLLMRAFMDECEHFSRSPQGTMVRMIKRLHES
ncbi:ATP-binding protein [Bryobacter aggregatus]|uniref:ATP-binding protein n=1 Tax=Bryobacter aggregatus TaxID=360054 RepID=UPI0004E1F302|nr:ATP-binding protein [Bryobacter aggregatus]